MSRSGYGPPACARSVTLDNTATPDNASYRQLLQQLNQQVSFLEMQFERIRLPADDQWYVCATNKCAKDSAVKAMGSRFSAEQRDFFRAVVEAIGAESPAEDSQVLAAVSQITLINLDVKRPPLAAAAGDGAGPSQAVAAAPGPKKALGKGEREAALQALAADGWLVAPRAGYYTLGPRTLAELKDLVEASVPEETAVKLREKYL